jgi:hypothetical protein
MMTNKGFFHGVIQNIAETIGQKQLKHMLSDHHLQQAIKHQIGIQIINKFGRAFFERTCKIKFDRDYYYNRYKIYFLFYVNPQTQFNITYAL